MKQGNEEFANRLRMLRTNARMSQAELAQRVGVDLGSVGNWEAGAYMPSLKTTVRLADVFGVSLDQLAGREPVTIQL